MRTLAFVWLWYVWTARFGGASRDFCSLGRWVWLAGLEAPRAPTYIFFLMTRTVVASRGDCSRWKAHVSGHSSGGFALCRLRVAHHSHVAHLGQCLPGDLASFGVQPPTGSTSDSSHAQHSTPRPAVRATASGYGDKKSQAPRPAARLTLSSSTSNTIVASRLVSSTDRSRLMDGNCGGMAG